jgi:ABC-type transport system substrate-binding protein
MMQRKMRTSLRAGMCLLLTVAVLVACGPAPAPVEVEKIVTQVVVETVIVEVEGTPQVVEKVVEKEVEKIVTPTAEPMRDVLIVGLARNPLTLDPADHRHRETETVIRNMFDGLVTRDTTSGVHLELAEGLELGG